jgi:hypothetical protein
VNLANQLLLSARHELRDQCAEYEEPGHRFGYRYCPDSAHGQHIAVADRSGGDEAEVDRLGKSSRLTAFNETRIAKQPDQPADAGAGQCEREPDQSEVGG